MDDTSPLCLAVSCSVSVVPEEYVAWLNSGYCSCVSIRWLYIDFQREGDLGF